MPVRLPARPGNAMLLRRNRPLTPAASKPECSTCTMRGLCLPMALGDEDLARLDDLVASRERVRRGETLYVQGDAFTTVYAVSTGLFKSRVMTLDGREQVTGFQLPGDLLGLDAASAGVHRSDAVALQDAFVCAIPYERLEQVSRHVGGFHRLFHGVLSREVVRQQGMMLLLGSMHAEERLATFLLNLAQRLASRGLSATELRLGMSREEIGTYLGLTLETVSRCFSRFHDRGWLDVRQRNIRILDRDALTGLVSPFATH
jgi:CRP/FNR family transcriptional regulator